MVLYKLYKFYVLLWIYGGFLKGFFELILMVLW